MSLDLTTYPLRYRRGGTTYSFHGYTSAQGGTRYLAIRRGGVVRYIPFTTGGTYYMRLRWSNTTYKQLLASSNVVVSYSIERGTASGSWNRNMRVKINSVSSNYGLTTSTSISVSIKDNNTGKSSSASVTLSANSTSAGGSSWSSYVLCALLIGYTVSVYVTTNGVSKRTSFESKSIDNVTKSFTATFS